MGVGKDMTNGDLGGFFKTMHCPKCPYNREHWDNCNKVGQVSQLFFSRIVDVLMSHMEEIWCYVRIKISNLIIILGAPALLH